MTSNPSLPLLLPFLAFSALVVARPTFADLLPEEKPLWPATGWNNPIHYEVAETVRQHDANKASPSGLNRVYTFVSKPSYSIHQPAEGTANGVGLVICPGGGFRELWLDREGHDLALWLKARGVTSLVLKYRLNAELEGGKRKFPSDIYQSAVAADARQAIHILRAQAPALKLNPNRIGICGFSAGGTLALHAVLRPEVDANAIQGTTQPDFAGLFYPGLGDANPDLVAKAKKIPPLFIMNAIDDSMTPVNQCMDLYQTLLKAGARAELHLFSKGGHGFDMGEGHGESVALWKESFVAWLTDSGFISGGAASSRPRVIGDAQPIPKHPPN
jgi:acetyl esterase/lipase